MPMPNASAIAFKGDSFEANDSTRPIMIQFTTMSLIKIPIDSESSGKKACIRRSTIVVNDAITIIKIGIRISFGINFRNILIIISLNTITKVIASPIPIPFATEVVMASAEQSPIISMMRGFSFTNPFVKIRTYSFITVLLLVSAAGAAKPLTAHI